MQWKDIRFLHATYRLMCLTWIVLVVQVNACLSYFDHHNWSFRGKWSSTWTSIWHAWSYSVWNTIGSLQLSSTRFCTNNEGRFFLTIMTLHFYISIEITCFIYSPMNVERATAFSVLPDASDETDDDAYFFEINGCPWCWCKVDAVTAFYRLIRSTLIFDEVNDFQSLVGVWLKTKDSVYCFSWLLMLLNEN